MTKADAKYVSQETWDKVRHLFTQEEKDLLSKEICGATVCPRGMMVTINKQTAPLLQRITDNVKRP